MELRKRVQLAPRKSGIIYLGNNLGSAWKRCIRLDIIRYTSTKVVGNAASYSSFRISTSKTRDQLYTKKEGRIPRLKIKQNGQQKHHIYTEYWTSCNGQATSSILCSTNPAWGRWIALPLIPVALAWSQPSSLGSIIPIPIYIPEQNFRTRYRLRNCRVTNFYTSRTIRTCKKERYILVIKSFLQDEGFIIYSRIEPGPWGNYGPFFAGWHAWWDGQRRKNKMRSWLQSFIYISVKYAMGRKTSIIMSVSWEIYARMVMIYVYSEIYIIRRDDLMRHGHGHDLVYNRRRAETSSGTQWLLKFSERKDICSLGYAAAHSDS